MNSQWLKTEHHRLHVVEEWPDSPHKEAALNAIRSKLASLMHSLPPESSGSGCEICLSRPASSALFRVHLSRRATDKARAGLAA
jgi:hypothetical protein